MIKPYYILQHLLPHSYPPGPRENVGYRVLVWELIKHTDDSLRDWGIWFYLLEWCCEGGCKAGMECLYVEEDMEDMVRVSFDALEKVVVSSIEQFGHDPHIASAVAQLFAAT